MATFSDLMNLLLCFFVLLFSMSTVDAEKLQEVVASMQTTVSILPAGSTSIGDGQMISAGVRQLEFLDSYYNEMANSAAEDSEEQTEGKTSVQQAYEEQALSESEEMAESIQNAIDQSGLKDQVEIDFNAEYVQLNLSGAILFDSGKADLLSKAVPIIDKIGKILEKYDENIIEIEGHTDNVPIHSAKYESNEVLSMYRALAVTERLRENTSLNPKYLKFAGRGDYVPVADNNTAEGRALNRRVEIKVYNSFNSDLGN
jgi:chemotaxis protein MotB